MTSAVPPERTPRPRRSKERTEREPAAVYPVDRRDAMFEKKATAVDQVRVPHLLETLFRQWKMIALVAISTLIGGTLQVESLPDEYDATALVAVGPRATVPSAGADTVRVVAPKYGEYIVAPSTVARVAPRVGEPPELLERAVSATVARDTGNIEIVARMRSPERAAVVANAFAREAINFSEEDSLLAGQLVALALPPAKPAAPRRRLMEGGVLLIGLVLGSAIALLLERSRPRVQSWREIGRLSGYPVLGTIPRDRSLRKSPRLAFAEPRIAAAARTLRANIEPALDGSRENVILLTSPKAGDGKSAVSAMLGESLARLGMSVLIVDADLHRPTLAEIANVRRSAALGDVLRKIKSLDDAIVPGWREGLFVLATAAEHDAGDLLARHFSEVLNAARERFDVVIVDSPPILGTDDARTLARLADTVLLVVSSGTLVQDIHDAVAALEAVAAHVGGVVANRFRNSETSDYGYYGAAR